MDADPVDAFKEPLPSLAEIDYDSSWKDLSRSAPPRPSNPFIIFRQWHANRMATKRANGDSTATSSDSKLVSLLWKRVPGLQSHFEELAQQVLAKHKERFPDYRYQPSKADATGDGTKSGKRAKAARKENSRPYPEVNTASGSASSSREGGGSRGLKVEEVVEGASDMRPSNRRRRNVVDVVKENSPDVQAAYIGTLRGPLEQTLGVHVNLHHSMGAQYPLPFSPFPLPRMTFQPRPWSGATLPTAPEMSLPIPSTRAVLSRSTTTFEQSFPIVIPHAHVTSLPFPLQPSSTMHTTCELHVDSEPHHQQPAEAPSQPNLVLRTDSGLDLSHWDFDINSPIEFIDPQRLTVKGEEAVGKLPMVHCPSPTTLLADYYSAKW